MLYIGLVLGVFAGNIAAHAAGMDAARVYVATVILMVPALAGARLLYVAAEWNFYRRHLRRIWDRSDGGYIMYGGLPAALLISIPLLRVLHVSIAGFWDIAIFTILVGMFFTRIGCLLHGCCGGRAWNGCFSLRLPDRNGIWEHRVPTQLLEAAWAAALVVIGVSLRSSMPFRGALFLVLSFGYSVGRLLMEFARDRQPKSGFSVAHWVTVLILLLSSSALALYWPR